MHHQIPSVAPDACFTRTEEITFAMLGDIFHAGYAHVIPYRRVVRAAILCEQNNCDYRLKARFSRPAPLLETTNGSNSLCTNARSNSFTFSLARTVSHCSRTFAGQTFANTTGWCRILRLTHLSKLAQHSARIHKNRSFTRAVRKNLSRTR